MEEVWQRATKTLLSREIYPKACLRQAILGAVDWGMYRVCVT